MSSYIHWIRQHLGSQKILLVGASACIRDGDGRLLLQRRTGFDDWGLPGGALELDESLLECIVREVREETGLEVEPTRLVGVYSSPDFDVTYPNGDQLQLVLFCFECGVKGGGLQPDRAETLDLAWFAPRDVPSTFASVKALLADLSPGQETASFRRGSAGGRLTQVPLFQRMRRYIGRAPYVMPAAAAFVKTRMAACCCSDAAIRACGGCPAVRWSWASA